MAAYYAAGVGMLFLFLSGFQSALSVIEERDAGVMERIAAGPYGVRPMIDGKFAFLTAQGLIQLIVIFIVAVTAFGVSIGQSPLLLLITIILSSICAAGLCLAIVGCCRTRSQAHAVGAVLALVMGALGGLNGAAFFDGAGDPRHRRFYAERLGYQRLQRQLMARRRPFFALGTMGAFTGDRVCGVRRRLYRDAKIFKSRITNANRGQAPHTDTAKIG